MARKSSCGAAEQSGGLMGQLNASGEAPIVDKFYVGSVYVGQSSKIHERLTG